MVCITNTPQRIGQIQARALVKLRKRLRAMGITKVSDVI